jgi:hypothetical protein
LQVAVGVLKALFTTSPLKTSDLIEKDGRIVVVTHERRPRRDQSRSSSLD